MLFYILFLIIQNISYAFAYILRLFFQSINISEAEI